jgi:hypothetical protein
MKKVLFLLILIQSLVSLPLAHGENTWVLWLKSEYDSFKNHEPESHIYWEVIDGFGKEADCKAYREGVWTNLKKGAEEDKAKHLAEEVTAVPYSLIMTRLSGTSTHSQNLYCLPGTIDPSRLLKKSRMYVHLCRV